MDHYGRIQLKFVYQLLEQIPVISLHYSIIFRYQLTDQWNRFAYALPNAANRYFAFRYLIYDAITNSNYVGIDLVEVQRHTTSNTFQLSVDVANGWNMVSVPGLNTPDQNVNTWWAFRDPGAKRI